MTPIMAAPWPLDLLTTFAVMLVIGCVVIGHRQARGGHWTLPNPRRTALLLQGGLVLCLAVVAPIATLRPYLFAVDTLQHMLLMMVAPPLLLLGWPTFTAERGSQGWAPRGLVRRASRWFVRARVALVLYVLVLWASYLPFVYESALRSEPLHAALHGVLFAAALVFWRPVVGPGSARLTPGRALAYLAVVVVAQPKLLAGLFTMVNRPLYVYYTQVPRPWGLSALDDQQLAAWLLGLSSILPLTTAMVACFLAYLAQEDREQAAREAAEQRDLVGSVRGVA